MGLHNNNIYLDTGIMQLLHRDIYQITSKNHPIQWVKVRGRVRAFANQIAQNLLIENDEADKNIVRFAILTTDDAAPVQDYIRSIIPDAEITKLDTAIPNPVLSKIKINDDSRYT